jgi:hypothetical protein
MPKTTESPSSDISMKDFETFHREILARETEVSSEELRIQQKRKELEDLKASYNKLCSAFGLHLVEPAPISNGSAVSASVVVSKDYSKLPMKEAIRRIIPVVAKTTPEFSSRDILNFIEELPDGCRPAFDPINSRSNVSASMSGFSSQGFIEEVSPASGRRPAVYRLATSTKEGG